MPPGRNVWLVNVALSPHGGRDDTEAVRTDDAHAVARGGREHLVLHAVRTLGPEHPDKTRLIEFGRFAASNRKRAWSWEAGDVRFLGLHAHLREDEGRALLAPARHDQEEAACQAEAGESRASAMQAFSHPRPGRWLASVVRGDLAYYAVPGNIDAVSAFRDEVRRLWHETLRRRSQRRELTWERKARSPIDGCLPPASCIPIPACASQPGPKVGARCGSSARRDLSGGPPARAVPTGITDEAAEQAKPTAAEVVEGRGRGEGNPGGTKRPGHRAGSGVSHVPDRVRPTGAGDNTDVDHVAPRGRAVGRLTRARSPVR